MASNSKLQKGNLVGSAGRPGPVQAQVSLPAGADVKVSETAGGWCEVAEYAEAKSDAPGVASAAQRGVSSQVGPPKAIQETPIVKWQAYFNANAAVGSVTVSPAQIAGACGGYCYAANASHAAWASTIRLKSITIWPAINSTTTQSLVDVVWNSSLSNFTKDVDFVQPSPFGNSVPRGMRFVPPKNTLLQGWLKATNTAAMMTITMPIGSILLLDVEYTLTNALAGPTVAIASGAAGTAYYLALDGPTSNKILPLALNYTA